MTRPPIDPDDDGIIARRLRERWHEIEWVTRDDDRLDPRTGERIYPAGSKVQMYDAYTDWILNGQDNLTFAEWSAADRPRAINSHNRPAFPSNIDIHR